MIDISWMRNNSNQKKRHSQIHLVHRDGALLARGRRVTHRWEETPPKPLLKHAFQTELEALLIFSEFFINSLVFNNPRSVSSKGRRLDSVKICHWLAAGGWIYFLFF